jgi:hypothetical protein
VIFYINKVASANVIGDDVDVARCTAKPPENEVIMNMVLGNEPKSGILANRSPVQRPTSLLGALYYNVCRNRLDISIFDSFALATRSSLFTFEDVVEVEEQ